MQVPVGWGYVPADHLLSGDRIAWHYPLGLRITWVGVQTDGPHRHIYVHDHMGGTWILEADQPVLRLATDAAWWAVL